MEIKKNRKRNKIKQYIYIEDVTTYNKFAVHIQSLGSIRYCHSGVVQKKFRVLNFLGNHNL